MSLDSYLHGDYQRALELTRQDPGRQSSYLYVRYISIYGELGRKQEALENWRKLLAEPPDWSAESCETWWRTRNMRDEDIAKLMDGVYRSGAARGGRRYRATEPGPDGMCSPLVDWRCPLWVISGHSIAMGNVRFAPESGHAQHGH